MFTSKVANLIDDAIQECIDYGSGKAATHINGKDICVLAEWENETAIEVVVKENRVIRFSWTEEVPEQYD